MNHLTNFRQRDNRCTGFLLFRSRGKSVIAKGARPLVMNLEHDIKLSKNMIVMSASLGDQISSTYEEKGTDFLPIFC